MTRLSLLITKPPHSDEAAEHMCGISKAAIERGMDVTVYLLGDGVLCSKRGQKGHIGDSLRRALDASVTIRASARDLRARAIGDEKLEPGVEAMEDIEGEFVKDVMERADRVIVW